MIIESVIKFLYMKITYKGIYFFSADAEAFYDFEIYEIHPYLIEEDDVLIPVINKETGEVCHYYCNDIFLDSTAQTYYSEQIIHIFQKDINEEFKRSAVYLSFREDKDSGYDPDCLQSIISSDENGVLFSRCYHWRDIDQIGIHLTSIDYIYRDLYFITLKTKNKGCFTFNSTNPIMGDNFLETIKDIFNHIPQAISIYVHDWNEDYEKSLDEQYLLKGTKLDTTVSNRSMKIGIWIVLLNSILGMVFFLYSVIDHAQTTHWFMLILSLCGLACCVLAGRLFCD